MLHRQSSSRSGSGTPWRYEQDLIEEPVCQASWGDSKARSSHGPVHISQGEVSKTRQARAESVLCRRSQTHRRRAGQSCFLSGAVADENLDTPLPKRCRVFC